MAKKALITGVSGQDGAYLSKFLLSKGYEVVGAFRRSASAEMWRLHELGIDDEVELIPLELLEYSNIRKALDKVAPDEVYNLAAQSFVGVSFDQPIYTAEVDALGVTRLLEALREHNPQARFYQASTSEMFGKVQETPQLETTAFHPRSPYGVAKLYAHWMTVNYREAYGIHASSGILFNHESPLRGAEFVTRKITIALAKIKYGEQQVLELGNLDTFRDWGYAGDYVEGMWRMLQQSTPDDYILATGETHSVREFVERAAEIAGFKLVWEGEGVDNFGVDKLTGKTIVRVNPEFYRPAEVDMLLGNPAKAQRDLGWERRMSFDELVANMVEVDMERIARSGAGH